MLLAAPLVATGVVTAGPAVASPSAAGAAATPLQRWLAASTVRIAHRGGSANWPEASPRAYANATAWSPDLALEFPARRTADGVWVGSEEASTGRVFGRDLVIAQSTWAQLSTLRSTVGNQPLSRLQQTVLAKLPADRIVFVDDKDDAYVDQLLNLVDRYGGKGRTVVKSYFQFTSTPATARARGYTTWGYFYEANMGQFAAEQGKFDLLGMQYDASATTFRTMLGTGKRVIAHIVSTDAQADAGLAKGATGLMVSGVKQVVPRG